MKLLIAVLLLASLSPAQAEADFSGIFLRTVQGHAEPAVPRILEVTQTADEVVATATENGETAVVRYRLDGKKTNNVQARLKGKNLVLKTIVQRQWPATGIIGPSVASESLEEKWELSPDGRQLVIHTKRGIGVSDSDIYTRQPSLDAAQVAAQAAEKKSCETGHWISYLNGEKETHREYGQGAELGVGLFQQVTRCAFYNAVLSGDFFKYLVRTNALAHAQFSKKGEPVTAYAGDIVLEVEPRPWACSAEIGNWVPTAPPRPELARELRFMVRWLGAEPRDIGEVPSESLREPWREKNVPSDFYRMQIPAKDIPLTDELEVLIFSKDGEQLACLKGPL
jgi:hypothetical protein